MRRIEHSYTVGGDLSNAFYVYIIFCIIAGGAASSFGDSAGSVIGVIIIAGTGVVIYMLWSRFSVLRYLKKRADRMKLLAASNHYSYSTEFESYRAATNDPRPLLSTLCSIDSDERPQLKNFLVSTNWTYFDLSYSTYRHTRGGRYKSADVFYGVMQARLPRDLPNVFFESKKGHERHLRFVFKRKQIHHLEGDFDQFFTTYYPENYDVDTLSFITPDVMQALKSAADYDVEIAGNILFMYGAIFDIDSQLADMTPKLEAIKKSLEVTAASYHDDRLPEAEGWQDVASQGAFLQRSKFWAYVSGGVLVIIFVLQFVLGIISSRQ